ncbi:RagB/SusD family nutrient uptake outer membrane protein [Chitinophaga agrisoli]|uniref:RagB/SusD family nutrient uptake outer membrane protein n=1 Tax=Chitinophaga agrisoli TaxID=2607653 RepID=A0A5B2VMG4_9BACT|nr:RagB/SusD family nutrient uptake outer membrane protein [Chitinophaga agrisoli]KAA2240241.1 RagB/SusD family nutrient uptake outer membrane protein [Chitinophaga agrisoli]
MKNYLLYIIVFAAALCSCKQDFLELTPEDSPNANDFFKTEAQFQQALTGAYQSLRGMASQSAYLMGEMRSDNTHYDFYAKDRGIHILRRENIDNFLDDAQNQWSNQFYFDAYTGIARCNTVISRLESVELGAAVEDQLSAEARFLRAYYYFNLVRYFGGVPLYLKEVIKQEDAFVPRATAEETYNTIIEDAKYAISKLAAPAAFPQTGRATLGAAKTLLAEVYITRKQYAEASPLLKDVTQMGYALLSNYADVYALQNKNSTESVLEAQFQQGDQGQQSQFIYWFMPKTKDAKPITGVTANTLLTGGWNVPTQDMLDAYEPGDKRKDASVAVAEGVIDTDGEFKAESLKSIVNYQAPAGKVYRLFIRKYLHAHSREANTDDNWPLYRYADVLLLLAESLNEEGKGAEALPYLNQVRTRAGLTAATATDQATLRDIIAHERRVELAFENHRWNDLVRTGKAITVMTAHGVKLKQQYSYLTASSYQVTQNRLVYPIPYSEMQLNKQLIQNNGY